MDVKVVDGNKTRVIERGRVAEGMDASKAATQNIAFVEDSTLKVSQFGSDDGKAIDRSVTVELPRRVAEHLKGVNAHVARAICRLPVSSVMVSIFSWVRDECRVYGQRD